MGYSTQGKIYNAIKHYGWENIEHKILIDGLTKQQAEKLETILIQAYDSIENGYNTAIGGNKIKASYLNEHVLYMIRESKRYDKKYGQKQPIDGIVSFAEKAKYNEERAKYINEIDGLIQSTYNEYKSYSGVDSLNDFGQARVDCYWWTMNELLTNGKLPESEENRPYWDAWSKQFLA